MLVYTDEYGGVVLIEDRLAHMLGYDDPDDAVGDPLGAVLGLESGVAEELLRQAAAATVAKLRLARVSNRLTGLAWWVLIGGSAAAAEGRFIGADFTVTPPIPPALILEPDHRAHLEQMAAIVRARVRDGGGVPLPEAKELELRSYVAARMLALYVLVTRMGGRFVGQTLEEKVRRLSREHGWPMDMDRGRLSLGEGELQLEACAKIMRVALAYAVQVTSKRLVYRELAELDVNFSRLTVQRATQYGLRPDS